MAPLKGGYESMARSRIIALPLAASADLNLVFAESNARIY
jgi:hypothetical protein